MENASAAAVSYESKGSVPYGSVVRTKNRVRRKVFVSYASEDTSFARLIVALLEHHGHRAWSAATRLEGGDRFRGSIDAAIRQADTMVVLVGAHTVQSKWVAHEIATFRSCGPNSPVIPVLLQPVPLAEVAPGLEDSQAISFSESMVNGFQNLFGALQDIFLPSDACTGHGGAGCRRIADRRVARDRRKSNVRQRLRVGSWLAYARETRKGAFEEIRLATYGEFDKLKRALAPELSRYELRDGHGERVSAQDVLESVADQLWLQLRGTWSKAAVMVVELAAEEICQRCHVAPVDRRQQERRCRPA